MEIVLKHHRIGIQDVYRNCPIGKIPLVAEGIIRDMKFVKDLYGNAAYPGLDKPEVFERMVTAEIKQAKAVLTGKYIEISDTGEDGRTNFDDFCKVCVNYRPQTETCDFEERYLRWCSEKGVEPYI